MARMGFDSAGADGSGEFAGSSGPTGSGAGGANAGRAVGSSDSPAAASRAGVRIGASRGQRSQTQTAVETGDAADGRKPRRSRRRRDSSTEHSALGERLIAGVPARIMRPRLVFAVCLAAILAFGLLMVYSASSVEALKEQGSSTFFFVRQAAFIAVGVVGILIVTLGRGFLPWQLTQNTGLLLFLWGVILLLLLAVLLVGSGGESWGASRWIFGIQPSEFAKPVIVMVAAKILADYYEDCSIDTPTFLFTIAAAVGVPAALIFFQPDLGTTLIILGAVFFMAYLSGISYRLIAIIVVVAVVVVLAMIFSSPYRMERMFAQSDPWSDPYDTGYQATLAIMAFASGGLFGRGIGNSTIKYSYLPEAHNDYILAIIGEELGFVGTALFLILFVVLMFSAFSIARRSPTLHGQLIAGGAAAMLSLQFFINVLGILNITPMTGKPLPFISYGGSSILTSLILAALILRVSFESNVATVHDARRADFALMDEQDVVSDHIGRSTAGQARVRSTGRRAVYDRDAGRSNGFSVYDGGSAASDASRGGFGRRGSDAAGSAGWGRSDRGRTGGARGFAADCASGGYERINLGGGGTDRLRRDGVGPRVDHADTTGSSRARRSGDGRDGYGSGGRDGGRYGRTETRGTSRRDRYDR